MANSLLNYQLVDQEINLENRLDETSDDQACLTSFDKQAISIHKFGGSSLATSQALLNVVNIITNQTQEDDFIVVSANGKVTDWLLALANGQKNILSRIKNNYHQLVTESLTKPDQFLAEFNHNLIQLESNIFSKDEILAYGEIWSAKLLVALLDQKNIPALFVDGRDILRTDAIDNYEGFENDYFDHGLEKIRYGNFSKRLIITGYIAKNIAGKSITLGRNGSDYTASLLANLTNAKKVVLWTDVNGIFNADPNIIQSAKPAPHLSFSEAQALASIGTNVLHKKTIAPLRDKQIPLFVRSSQEPDNIGSCISDVNDYQLLSAEKQIGTNAYQVKSIAIKQDLLSVKLKIDTFKSRDLLLANLSNTGIFSLETSYTASSQKLSILIEKAALNETIQLLESLKISFLIEKEVHSLVALVGNEISYQKSFLQILQKILSIQYQFQVVQNDFNDLVLISTEEKNSLDFFELIYHCCTSAEFCNQASLSFSGDYSLFEKHKRDIDSLLVSEVN